MYFMRTDWIRSAREAISTNWSESCATRTNANRFWNYTSTNSFESTVVCDFQFTPGKVIRNISCFGWTLTSSRYPLAPIPQNNELSKLAQNGCFWLLQEQRDDEMHSTSFQQRLSSALTTCSQRSISTEKLLELNFSGATILSCLLNFI